MTTAIPEFGYQTEAGLHTVPVLRRAIIEMMPRLRPGMRLLDIGCGNGYWCGQLHAPGVEVVGIDPSAEGISVACRSHPGIRFEQLPVTANLLEVLGERPFDAVLSVEVVEHVYAPRDWAAGAFGALKPGGRLVCTTPYHGYLKNLALAILGRWDSHASPLWDGGHIKLWSRKTLGQLLAEAGFENLRFRGAGRAPYLWWSMVMSADRPRDGASA